MQMSVEKLSEISRKISFEIEGNQIKAALNSKIQKAKNSLKINGFRPGHVPVKLVLEKYGLSIYQEVIDSLLNQNLNKILTEQKLDLMGEINLEKIDNPVNINNGECLDPNKIENITCVFNLEVYPEVNFNDFKNLTFKTPIVEISSQDIETKLIQLREQFGSAIVVDKVAAVGDLAIIDYIGNIEGKEFPGGKGEDLEVKIGSQQFIEGFEAGLVGSKAGDDLQLNLAFPEDYADRSLAGKLVTFDIKVKNILETKLAEINEEFAKRIKLPNADLTKMEQHIKSMLQQQIRTLTKNQEKQAVKQALIKSYPIELPEKLVSAELDRLRTNVIKDYRDRGIYIKELNPEILNKLTDQAKNNVHESLLLRSIIKQNNLEYDKKLVNEQLNQFDSYFKKHPNFNKMRSNFKNSIVNASLVDASLEFVMNQAIKIEDPMSLDELNKINDNNLD